MCGIAGIVGQNNKINSESLKRMTDAIAHRGPDGEGSWINSGCSVGFGHRRLAIIDLSDTGKQPMSYSDGRYAITYNGEIYNYLELREELESRGYRFVSTSDTEVLLALFSERKENCLEDLDGMFAFAIWDKQEQQLFAARDRFGEKPFYYAIHSNSLYFASEMKALWAAGVPRVVSDKMLFNYLTNASTYNPSDLTETFFKGIFKLKASHYFLLSPARLHIDQTRYWTIDKNLVDHRIPEDEAAEKFRDLFNESVQRRLRSDVPVGSSLSGGLDSSLIVSTIDRLNRGKHLKQATFSARFPGFAKDEGRFMQAVIDSTNVEPHFVYPDEKDLVDNIEKLFHHQEEPFGSASIYAQYCVMRLAKDNNVTVLLDGQGADELLAGYPSLFIDDYLRELRSADRALRRREMIASSNLHSLRNGNRGLNTFAKRIMPELLKVKARQIRDNMRSYKNSFLNADFRREYSSAVFAPRRIPSSLQESLHHHAVGGPLEELLRFADRNSMAHSREVRLPFLHHRLAEFLFSLPPNFKIRGGVTKYILREAFKDVLPEPVLNRTDKVGYEPPQGAWMQNPHVVEMIQDAAGTLVDREILDKKALNRIATRGGSSTQVYQWKVLMAGCLFKR